MEKLSAGLDAYMVKQATRQISAARDRPMEWDFADKIASDRIGALFNTLWDGRIKVRNRKFPGF